MRHIVGKCHCGNIEYEFHWPGATSKIPVRACSCSFCLKHSGVYTSHPKGKLEAHIADQTLVNKYTFGTSTAEFYVCSACGVVPFVTSTIEGNQYAVVNVNTFENVDSSEFESSVSDFDGEGVDDRLARRQRNWISDVTVSSKQTPRD